MFEEISKSKKGRKLGRLFGGMILKVVILPALILILVVLYFMFPQSWTEPDEYIEGLHGQQISLSKGIGYYEPANYGSHFILIDDQGKHIPLSKNHISNKKLSNRLRIDNALYAFGFESASDIEKVLDHTYQFTIVDSYWICETGFTIDQQDTHYLVLRDEKGVLSFFRTSFLENFNKPNLFNLTKKRGLKCWVKGF